MNINLDNKTVLITGANGQVGSQLAKSFKDCGANVLGVDYDDFDITNESSTEKFFLESFDKYKKIDVLINNAGVSTFDPFLDRKKEDFQWVSDVNLWGTFNCIKNYAKNFTNRDLTGGSIINVGSIYGVVSPDPRIYTDCLRRNSEIYGASKAGIIQMSKYFAVHLANKKIRVNCVSPGGIFNPDNPQGDNFIENYEFRCPMKKMASVEDMAGAFLFLASDMSKYVSGQNITIDGGFSSW